VAKIDRAITKQMEAADWELRSAKNHLKWFCRCGEHIAIQSSSVGKGRGVRNFKSLMKNQGECSVNLKLG
jgi:hypothetical protein